MGGNEGIIIRRHIGSLPPTYTKTASKVSLRSQPFFYPLSVKLATLIPKLFYFEQKLDS